MKRRSVIKKSIVGASALFLAGCSAPTNGEQTEPIGVPTQPNNSSNNTTTPKNPETEPKQDTTYDITAITSQSEEFPLDYSAEIITGGYDSPQTPLTIEVTITNPTDKQYFYRDRRKALFTGVQSEQEFVTLYPTEEDSEEDEYQFAGGCWSRKNFFGMDSNLLRGELEAGESHSELLVLALPEDAVCPEPSATLTFTTTVQYSESQFVSHSSEVMTGVTLTLKQN